MNSTTMEGHLPRRRDVWLLLVTIFLAMPLAAATARIDVMISGGTTISVIDPATNKVVEVIKGIESPEVVRFSPDGSRIDIATRSEDVLYVMDRKSGKYIKKVPLSGWLNDAAATNDGKLILICIRNTGTEAEDIGALDIIDAKSLQKVKSIPVKRGLHDLALTGDGKYVAAGSPGGKFITVFDLQRMEIAWEVDYDQGVLPLTIELYAPVWVVDLFSATNESDSGWWILRRTKRLIESTSLIPTQRVSPRVRGHQPRYRHSAGQ